MLQSSLCSESKAFKMFNNKKFIFIRTFPFNIINPDELVYIKNEIVLLIIIIIIYRNLYKQN